MYRIDYNTFYSVETSYVYYDGSDRTIDWISVNILLRKIRP